MEKQQTAVELLERRIMNTSITSNGQMIFYHEELKRWLDEAKAMEKEQKMQDYSVGYSNGQVGSNRTAEQYYNDTFNK